VAPIPRRVSRERVLRALYLWQIAGGDYASLLVQVERYEPEEKEAAGDVELTKPHTGFLRELLDGVLKEAANLDAAWNRIWTVRWSSCRRSSMRFC
jgi:transcription termination factor NusB